MTIDIASQAFSIVRKRHPLWSLSPYRPAPRAELISVGSTYAVQGLGYAVVVTSLPTIQARQSLDATMVALLLLGVSLAAAGGSVLADAIAVRRNSKAALLSGIAAQAVGFFLMATAQPAPIYMGAVLVFGVGLGAVDASTAMQGVLVQRGRPRPLLGRFFAAYTLAAIVGAFLMVALVETPAGAGAALAIVGIVDVLVIVAGWRLLDTGHAARAPGHARDATRIPRWPVFVIGALILAAFVADSAVSTWSSVYLSGTLHTAAWAAPLGYAAYQIVVLVSRLGVDYLARRTARTVIATSAIAFGGIGFVVIALVPTSAGAIIGFRPHRRHRGSTRPALLRGRWRRSALPQRRDHREGEPLQLRGRHPRHRDRRAGRGSDRFRPRLPDPARHPRFGPARHPSPAQAERHPPRGAPARLSPAKPGIRSQYEQLWPAPRPQLSVSATVPGRRLSHLRGLAPHLKK
ncbi:MFS transporter [Cryobacterium breve]|uniref:MFS transporter n=1 Tax=Cryobacterium breve TaxID=1259258 RepID=A0ABY7NFG1_9MICO|nr:MFS transporter [Cryobacterium breve]WBM80979.1 MFS transporter [Cryobacterium breve]